MRTNGKVWIQNEDDDEYWAEGADCTAVAEATDNDEVRISVTLADETQEVVGVYMSRSEADRLARFLAAASVSPVGTYS